MRICLYLPLMLIGLVALPVGCNRQEATAVVETDLRPLDHPGAVPDAEVHPVALRVNDDDKPRSRMIRALLEILDGLEGEGTDEERKLIHSLLMDADAELAEALGENSREAIMDANNRHQGFNVRRARLQQRPQSDRCCGPEEGDEEPRLIQHDGYQEFGTPPEDE